MRINKYRVWDKEEKEMLYSDPELTGTFDVFTGEWFGDNGYFKLPHIILLQYTGLKDNKKNEIFEGDIVIYMKLKLIVSFANGHFFIHKGKNDKDKFTHNHEDLWKALGRNTKGVMAITKQKNKVEIIGNIYENKELLK